MSWILHFFISYIWAMVTGLLRACVKKKILRPVRFSSWVISVGNLQIGGAGKTPLVMKIAGEAIQKGLTVAILTRGYGRKGDGGVIPPGPKDVDPEIFGDEPTLIHQRLPQVWISVGADRVLGYDQIRMQLGKDPSVVILDDGFQQWRIHRNVDVLAVTSARWGQKIFREFYSAARTAQLLVWTKGGQEPSWIKKQNPEAWVRMRSRLQLCLDPAQKFWLVCGVSDPSDVLNKAQEAGYSVIRHFVFADHARYGKVWIEDVLVQAQKARTRLLLTGKDSVKWKAMGFSDQNWVTLEPELETVEGGERWAKKLWDSLSS